MRFALYHKGQLRQNELYPCHQRTYRNFSWHWNLI